MGDRICAESWTDVSSRSEAFFQPSGIGRGIGVYIAAPRAPRISRGLGPRRPVTHNAGLILATALLLLSCGGPDTQFESSVATAPAGGIPAIDLRADRRLEAMAEAVGRDPLVWAPMPGIDSPVDLLAGAPVTVWFVQDLTRLDSPGLSAVEQWVAGVADPPERIIALRIDGPQRNLTVLRAVYRHEAAHVLLHAATGGNVPRWFHEGYAQAVSGTWDWNEGWRLHFVLLRHGQSILGNLDKELRSGSDPRAAYLLSYTAVATLREMGGDPGLSALFTELRGGTSFEAALRRVYGVTGRDFERRWREQVLDRYGWLYLFSRTGLIWMAVAVLVIGLGASRVRRDRERLERMIAEDEKTESESEDWTDIDDFYLGI